MAIVVFPSQPVTDTSPHTFRTTTGLFKYTREIEFRCRVSRRKTRTTIITITNTKNDTTRSRMTQTKNEEKEKTKKQERM